MTNSNLQQAPCPQCGQPLAGHSCPAVVIVAQTGGAYITRAAQKLQYTRGGNPVCVHCGGRHNWHSSSDVVAYECLLRQYRSASGDAAPFSPPLVVRMAAWLPSSIAYEDGTGRPGHPGRQKVAPTTTTTAALPAAPTTTAPPPSAPPPSAPLTTAAPTAPETEMERAKRALKRAK